MNDEQSAEAPSDGPETTQSAVARALGFVGKHPKTSLVVGAGISAFAGLELVAAALVGGAIAVALRRRNDKKV